MPRPRSAPAPRAKVIAGWPRLCGHFACIGSGPPWLDPTPTLLLADLRQDFEQAAVPLTLCRSGRAESLLSLGSKGAGGHRLGGWLVACRLCSSSGIEALKMQGSGLRQSLVAAAGYAGFLRERSCQAHEEIYITLPN